MLTCDRSQSRHYGDEHGRYWSVSQVCEVVAGKQDFYAAGSAERGTDVHLIFALAVGQYAGLCDGPDVPTEYEGYHQAILQWIEWAKPMPMPLGIERKRKHPTLPYAGTTDFVGQACREFSIVDLKTGAPAKWHALQMCGYREIVGKVAKMKILYITNDGDFKQVPVKPSPRDWCAFQNGLSILQWRTA
jgi:hypothetical protein